jgi:hypothetical protein
MKSINRTLRLLAVTAVAVGTLLSTAPAQAIMVSISPATQTINVGDPASIDIVVSGLTQPADAVGGFSLNLGFNNTFLSSVSYLNDPGGKMGALPLDLSGGFTPGSLDLFFTADAAETQASLAASQGASFTLARVSFSGLSPGLSPLTLSNVVLSNWDGTATLAGVTTQNGNICVAAAGATNCPKVPEPGTLVLLTLGMLGMGLTRRRRSS